MQKSKIAIFVLLILCSCATAMKFSGRNPASGPNEVEVPPGLTSEESADYEHLSEGSDIYPYEWMLALKSANFKDSKGKMTQPFLQNLDQRFGILSSHHIGKYMMPYVGLPVAWSNHRPEDSDALKTDPVSSVRKVDSRGKSDCVGSSCIHSIRMVGTNCTVCHTGAVRMSNGALYQLDGAPNAANIRGYFQDLAQSTIAVLAKKEIMVQFLEDLKVPDAKNRATQIHNFFWTELGKETGLHFAERFGDFGKFIDKLTIKEKISTFNSLFAAKKGNTGRYFKGKTAISLTLEKLLRATYGFSDSDDIGELKERMAFLGTLMVGTDPRTSETISGWGRTDAFGRIGNLVLRGDHPIDYTAPVSLPWIWGIKYQAMLHYTANTNSTLLRNMGQSLGLGSVILDTQGNTTVNVANLDHLETLTHKLQVPNWEKIFAQDQKMAINHSLANVGKGIYEAKCEHCHTAAQMVGPQNNLYYYNVIDLNLIKTDSMAAKNCVAPVDGYAFGETIFSHTEILKNRYYERWNISKAEQAELEYQDLRGTEFFRDTLNGFRDQQKYGNNYGNIKAGAGYMARHLAGVWATGPFLHNGSVPNLTELLKPANQRVRIFNVGSRDFDYQNVGFVSARKLGRDGMALPCKAAEEKCFDTTLLGNSNSGHEYGVDLSQSDKVALIEYLKILPPESKYSW